MKNRQIWSPASVCEREQVETERESPARWGGHEDPDSPLELVKRCQSNPDEKRPSSAEPLRCPSAPAYHSYAPPPPPPADINISLLLKAENKNEKSFQVFYTLITKTYVKRTTYIYTYMPSSE